MTTLFPIAGQPTILEMLHQIAAADQYANAYMFHGPDGVGKEALAMEFAALMNCQSRDERPCGMCQACKQMRQLEHPNLWLIFAMPTGRSGDSSDPLKGLSDSVIEEIQESIHAKTANPYKKIHIRKANTIRISSIRAMQKQIHMGMATAGRKVVLIFEAERMNTEAFNSILKIVEEPPAHTSFIFCTNSLHVIPETIQSRCQKIPVRLLTGSELKQGIQMFVKGGLPEHAERIIRMANGDLGFALSLASTDITQRETAIVEFLRAVMQGRPLAIWKQVDMLDGLYKTSPLEFQRFVTLVQFWFRDAQIWVETENPKSLVFEQLLEKIHLFTERYTATEYSTVQILLENAVEKMERNIYPRLVLFSLFSRLHQAILGETRKIEYGDISKYRTDRIS